MHFFVTNVLLRKRQKKDDFFYSSSQIHRVCRCFFQFHHVIDDKCQEFLPDFFIDFIEGIIHCFPSFMHEIQHTFLQNLQTIHKTIFLFKTADLPIMLENLRGKDFQLHLSIVNN